MANVDMQKVYEVLHCDTRGRFFDSAGKTSANPNELANPTTQIDDDAVFSVLQFGAIIPPLSPWRGVQRLLPGYRYSGNALVGPIELNYPTNVATLDVEQQCDVLERRLDGSLTKLMGNRQNPVLLFSGGVDSGLIASRLAALGYRDSLLMNYSFGEDDSESQLAEAMAQHLGLRFERVRTRQKPCNCLIDPGRIYPQPFGDHSTVPTSELANAVVTRLAGEHRVILDGTGADGAFGLKNKIKMWNRVFRVPMFAKKSASVLYSSMLWHRKGRLESLSRILRRSLIMPPLSAVLVQNSLSGVLYLGGAARTLDRLLADWVGGWAGDSLPQRIVAADLAFICSNIYAQKGQPILELSGHEICYPFLEADLVSLALESLPHWRQDQPKAVLKRCLARYVPRDMVYRPKSAFVDPRGTVFFDAEFIEHLRATADDTSPIALALNKRTLFKACDLLAHKTKLPPQTLNCLWAITFADRWYRSAQAHIGSLVNNAIALHA